MSLQTCTDLAEADVLEESLGLYLKPVSKIKINVQLPKLKIPGQSISSWNVMEKIKATVRPDHFINLKSLKITENIIKLEGEMENKASAERALARLRAAGTLKLSGFTENLQVRAAHAPCSGPTRHEWEAFYRDAKGVNEMRPGERPDTIHVQDIPIRWFASSSKPSKPSEKILSKAFVTFGRIRRVEIPSNESSSSDSVFVKKSTLHNDLLFEAYIQYEEYVEFSIAMDSLRGKKLLFKDADGKVYSADIKVDFDRTNYLSERRIKQRAFESKKVNGDTTESANKVPVESTKHSSSPISSENILLKEKVKQEKSSTDQRKISTKEGSLLLKELFTRIEKSERVKEKPTDLKCTSCQKPLESSKRKKESKEKLSKREKLSPVKEKEKHSHIIKKEKKSDYSQLGKKSDLLQLEKKQKAKLLEQERLLKEKLLQKMRQRELQKIAESREKLRKELAGRKTLKSVLAVP